MLWCADILHMLTAPSSRACVSTTSGHYDAMSIASFSRYAGAALQWDEMLIKVLKVWRFDIAHAAIL